MNTVRLEVTEHCYVFQPGNILELSSSSTGGNDAGAYCVPDIGNGDAGQIPADSVKLADASTADDCSEYYGKCLLTKVVNFNRANPESNETDAESIGVVKPEQVKIIHYSDCQQIVFHMPQYAYDAGTFQITELASGETIVKSPVRDQLNGGTMVLLDSLSLKPGFYNMEADWPNGWTHQIRFIKFAEGFPNQSYPNPPENVRQAIKSQEFHLRNLPAVEAAPQLDVSRLELPAPSNNYEHPKGNVTIVQNDREHRLFDSNGVEIKSGIDLDKFKTDVAAKFGPVVTYTQDGRGGQMFYKEGDVELQFDWEFAGGRGVVIILIPEERYWDGATKTPLSRREEILGKLARRVIADKAPGCDYEIYENTLDIVRK